jgi:hypothetical protein
MSILITSLIAIMLPACPPDLFSVTGPSHAEIKIVPIAFNKGTILFKTYHYINRDGSYRFHRTEFGWLVVSANGTWEEVPHIILDPEKMAGREEYLWEQSFRYRDEFDQDFKWSSPPDSVRRLLKKYGFTVRQRISATKGEGRIIWAPTRVCNRGKCARGTIVQRSLHRLRNVRGKGNRIRCSFYYAGVALFKNYDGLTGEKSEGAHFFIRNMGMMEDPEIDMSDVDAISIIR